MHYYACPYCAPHAQAKLLVSKELTTHCDCKKGFLWNKEKECKLKKYKCKEVLKCQVCESCFRPTEDFLEDQKRKIKDG